MEATTAVPDDGSASTRRWSPGGGEGGEDNEGGERGADAGLLAPRLERRELLPQRQDLEDEIATGAEGRDEGGEPDPDDAAGQSPPG